METQRGLRKNSASLQTEFGGFSVPAQGLGLNPRGSMWWGTLLPPPSQMRESAVLDPSSGGRYSIVGKYWQWRKLWENSHHPQGNLSYMKIKPTGPVTQ